MGLSSKKTKSTTTQNTTATTTPINPQSTTDAVTGLTGRVNDYFSTLDPKSLVPDADPLQLQAARAAGGLGTYAGYDGNPRAPVNPVAPDGTGDSGKAAYLAAHPEFATGGGLIGMASPELLKQAGIGGGSPSTGNPYSDAMNALKALMDKSGANTYDPTHYSAAKGSAEGYDPATGKAIGYDASLVGDPGQVQGESLLSNLDAYKNKYVNDVAKTSLADFDYGAGQTRAQNKLDLAGDSTFGGSGGAIQTALSEDALTRGRGALSAGIYKDAFDKAAELSNLDAARRQSATTTNAANTLARGTTNATATNDAARFGADANNTLSLADTLAMNHAREFGANARNTVSLADTAALNDANRVNAGADNTAGAFNATAADAARTAQREAALGLVDTANAQGTDARANIDAQSKMGDILRQIAQSKAGAPIAALLANGAALPPGLLELLKGTTSTGTLNGTSTGKESGASLGDWLGYFVGNAQAAAKASAGGG